MAGLLSLSFIGLRLNMESDGRGGAGGAGTGFLYNGLRVSLLNNVCDVVKGDGIFGFVDLRVAVFGTILWM